MLNVIYLEAITTWEVGKKYTNSLKEGLEGYKNLISETSQDRRCPF